MEKTELEVSLIKDYKETQKRIRKLKTLTIDLIDKETFLYSVVRSKDDKSFVLFFKFLKRNILEMDRIHKEIKNFISHYRYMDIRVNDNTNKNI